MSDHGSVFASYAPSRCAGLEGIGIARAFGYSGQAVGGDRKEPVVDSLAERVRVVRELRDAIVALGRPHPTRVAVDGVGAAGKTVLADELAAAIAGAGRSVIRAGIDGFHNPREVRHARGPESPSGYYLDSFDYGAVARCVLDPLGPGGDRRYRTAVYDFRTDEPVEGDLRLAGPDAILIFDGIFLQRSEIRDRWDFTIFVDAGFDVTVARAAVRDVGLFGSPQAVKARYEARYVPGERLYLKLDRPRERADVVVQNDDPANPVLEWSEEPDDERGRGRCG